MVLFLDEIYGEYALYQPSSYHIIKAYTEKKWHNPYILDELYGKYALELTSAYHTVETYFAKKGHKLYTTTYTEALNSDNM